MVRLLLVMIAAAAMAGCATKPEAFGEVPRDTYGRPLWSEVMKKATRPEAAPPQLLAEKS